MKQILMIKKLSKQEARKLILHAQKVYPSKKSGIALNNTLASLEHLGYIQIDTISAVQRAHHHTLWNRNPHYENYHLDQLVANKQVFEYWSHAAAYLPIANYRYSLPRKYAYKNGNEKHWYSPDKKVIKYVFERITKEGPLMAKDFENTGKKIGDWKTKPTKQALEHLFMQGDLMISKRVNFHKVYDLTEKVLPKDLNVTQPTSEEYAKFLITAYLKANGIGQAAEMSYLLKNVKPLILIVLQQMLENNELLEVSVNNQKYFALPSALNLLNKSLQRSKLKILSPFDNLLIQRKRIKMLFDFDYLIECYVPVTKRKFGYFSLPILWDGRLVARMDCRTDRKQGLLHMHHLALEPWFKKTDAFATALCKELVPFLKFNGCDSLKIHKTTPVTYKLELSSTLAQKINLSQ